MMRTKFLSFMNISIRLLPAKAFGLMEKSRIKKAFEVDVSSIACLRLMVASPRYISRKPNIYQNNTDKGRITSLRLFIIHQLFYYFLLELRNKIFRIFRAYSIFFSVLCFYQNHFMSIGRIHPNPSDPKKMEETQISI